MGYLDTPAKVLQGFVSAKSGYGSWPYNNGGDDPYWKFGPTPRDCFWKLTIQIKPQTHSNINTRQPKVYNGMDVKVGDYIASSADGLCVKITRIDRKTDIEIICVVEDVFRYNTFRDMAGYGSGIFQTPTNILIFETNEEGLPVVDPLPANSVGATFYPNLMSRFQNLEKNIHYVLEQKNHGFEIGDLISADRDSQEYVLTDSDHPYMVGTVSFVNGDDHFTVNPLQKIIDNLSYLPGEIGDVLYANSNNAGQLSLSGINPVMLKLRDHTQTEVRGVNVNAFTSPGNIISINGSKITISGPGTIANLVSNINAQTSMHGVIASEEPVPTVIKTSRSQVNAFYGEVLMAIPTLGTKPSCNINGVSVTFQTTVEGQQKYQQNVATAKDMAEDINDAGIPFIVASTEGPFLTITHIQGGNINIQNVVNDAKGHPIVGLGSATGLPSNSVGDNTKKIVQLTAVDAREINVANVRGTPVNDFGLYSVENGIKAAALYIEQGIRSARNTVVPNISSRDALRSMLGDQAYVLDKGDGEWGLYLFAASNWIMISSQESSKVDADTYTATLTHASTNMALGEINPGGKITQIIFDVTETFDGSPSLSIGDQSSSNRFSSNDDLDLSAAGTYIVTPSYVYPENAGDTMILINFTALLSTKGRVKITVSYQ